MQEHIHTIFIQPEDRKNIKNYNIGTIAGAIGFWDESQSIIPKEIPSIFSNNGYRNEKNRFIDINEQWPIQIFTITWNNAEYKTHKNITYTESDQFILWTIEIHEDDTSNWDELIKISQDAYEEIYELIQKTNKKNLIRIGNYVTDILGQTHITINNKKIITNRYKAFCTGRANALDNTFKLTNKETPTATWIGNHFRDKKWIKIIFIATTQNNVSNHTNPKQTNPLDYSTQKHWIKELWSKASTPRFNRSTTLDKMLFIGWTASILWEDEVHIGNIEKQTIQALQNMLYTMKEAERKTWNQYQALPIILKVFIKNKKDYKAIKEVIESKKNPLPNIIIESVYTHWDICRDHRLVEISCETVAPDVAKMILNQKIKKIEKEKNIIEEKIISLQTTTQTTS